MRFADSVEQEVTDLKLYLEEVPVFLGERTATAARADDAMARDAYRRTQTVALEGGIHLLNAMVDGALLILAIRTGGTSITAEDMSRNRKTLEREIETRLGLKLNTLPGWDQVDKIRREANAVKHRLGLTFAQGTEAPLAVTDDVNVTPAELLERLMGARVWLLDIDKRLS